MSPRPPVCSSLWFALWLAVCTAALADGPADNLPDKVRRVPALGIEVSDADRKELEVQLELLETMIRRLRMPLADAKQSEKRRGLLPDVEVFHKAVSDALHYQEFFNPNDVASAKGLLQAGIERAEQLRLGAAPWTWQTGLVVRGYISRIDGSVQPYGLVIPESYSATGTDRVRLDLWFHGRGEPLSEVNFLEGRRKQVGQIAPPNTIVLHPYGRYCNAFKFAGEVDVLEALESVRSHYRIDDDRTTVRGFSMGGAACWQFAVHYADRWAAAAPGAGFSETPDFLKVFQQETLQPTDYERKLWHLYDCTDYAVNLLQCPTVAYSGELDSQKQAADVMERAMEQVGLKLVHIIGPGTKHSYHPAAQAEIERRLESIVHRGRQPMPRVVRFRTYTLKYNRMAWVTVDGLGEHWQPSGVEADVSGNSVALKTENVTALTLSFPSGWSPFDPFEPVQVEIDGTSLDAGKPTSDWSWECRLERDGNVWKLRAEGPAEPQLRKVHDLQGPIDDAFMDSFLFVRPTGKSPHPKLAAWADAELERAIEHWRRHFRGNARVKNDTDVTDDDIASASLVLWGDAASNSVLAKVAEKLPIGWNADAIRVGEKTFDSENHALILIAPNPLNPRRYVVLNSSFTFRDYDYLNNARQVPKLPDWAVVDLNTPPGSQYPGKVVLADFFDEKWALKPIPTADPHKSK